MQKLIFKPRTTFIRDLHYLARIDPTIVKEVHDVIDLLCEKGNLPKEYKDHELTGIYEGYNEFHIRDTPKGKKPNERNDIVMIYKIRYHELTVVAVRIGSHPKLFSGRYAKHI